MAKAAQRGVPDAILALAAGLAKEAFDIVNKTKRDGFKNTVKDSAGDMRANITGIYRGLTNPNTNASLLMDDIKPKWIK